jgi:hypothetical protein
VQPKNHTFLDFRQRTDALAASLGFHLEDLPETIGISRASLFSYRAGKTAISKKAWIKLEQAERAHGISASFKEQFMAASEESRLRLIASATLPEIYSLLPPDKQAEYATKWLDMNISQIKHEIYAFLLDAQTLAELIMERGPKRELIFFSKRVAASSILARRQVDLLLSWLRSSLNLDPGDSKEIRRKRK